MLDQLKMSASAFLLGLKHGVYVFVSDACDYCKAYEESLKIIDNCNLHIVECVTEQDKSAIYQLTNKSALPITASFIDNELQWVTLGQLFLQEQGDDELEPGDWTINSLSKYLHDTFGEAPLSQEEIDKKMQKAKKRCYFAYYIFPETISDELRAIQLDHAIDHNELPIDVAEIEKLNISDDNKEIMLMSNVAYTKLVVFDIEHTDKYSALATKLLQTYYESTRTTAPVEFRGFK